MLSSSTVGYLVLAYASTCVNSVWGPINAALLSDVAKHALLPDTEWAEAVFADILSLGILFVLEWWANDFLSIVACNRSNEQFTLRIRNQLFAAIMRQV